MESHESQHSNPPPSNGTKEQTSPAERERNLVVKGLVSSRIAAYRTDAERPRDARLSYPPSFPRAHFERVQTFGHLPSYDPALYNQPHPRTMSLAPNAAFYDKQVTQHERHKAPLYGECEVKPTGSRSPGVARLMHLWESKGQTNQPFQLLSGQRNTSSVNDGIGPGYPAPTNELPSRRAYTSRRTVAPLSDMLLVQHVNSHGLGPCMPETEPTGWHVDAASPRKPTPFHLIEETAAACSAIDIANGASHTEANQPMGDTDRDHDSGRSTPRSFHSTVAFIAPDAGHEGTEEELPGQVRQGSQGPSRGPDVSSKAEHNQYQERPEMCPPLNDSSKIPRPARSRTRQGKAKEQERNTRSSARQRLQRPSLDAISPSGIEPLETGESQPTSNTTAGNIGSVKRSSSSSSHSKSLHHPVPRFPIRSTSRQTIFPVELSDTSHYLVTRSQSETPSAFSTPPASRIPRWRNLPPRQSQRTTDELQRAQARARHSSSAAGTPSSSSKYYSMESVRDTDAERHGSLGSSNRGSDRESIIQSDILDAAIQIDAAEPGVEETVSEWSGSGSIAGRPGRGVPYRVSRPVRLERRLRRSTPRAVRKVQVIVSLDGATDLAMDAELGAKGESGSCHHA